MKREGLTYRQAAKEFSIPTSTLTAILQAKVHRPGKDSVTKISKKIGISEEHAFLLIQIDDPYLPKSVKEILMDTYYDRQTKFSSVAEDCYKQYDFLTEGKREEEVNNERDQLKAELMRIWALKRTSNIWILYEKLREVLIQLQQQYLTEVRELAAFEGLLVGQEFLKHGNFKNVISKLSRKSLNQKVDMKILHHKVARLGYILTAIRIPKGHGTYEPCRHIAHGIEAGLVVRGEGAFFSKSLSAKEYSMKMFNANTFFSFSRHRSHCIFAEKSLELFHIQFPFYEDKQSLPVCFQVETGELVTYSLTRDATPGVLPQDLEILLKASRLAEA